jgi:PAP_fibrillin
MADGLWNLEYSTSGNENIYIIRTENNEIFYTDSIIGRNSFPRVGGILQRIDTSKGYAENSETLNFFGFLVKRKVTAELTALSSNSVKVVFKVFTIGPVSFKAPGSLVARLDVTYVDEDIRLSRGDKGNIFVLTRMKE